MATNYNAKVVTDGLVLCLDAANPRSYSGSGSTVYDLSNKGYDASIYQATYSNNGYFDFDGVDDNLYITSLSTNAPLIYNITTVVSGEVVYYPYSSYDDGDVALIRCGLGTDLTFGFFHSNTAERVFFHWYDTDFGITVSTSNVITLDAWNVASFVRNGTSISFYVNGSFINTNTGLTAPTPTPTNLGIGAARAGTGVGTTAQDLYGRIASVKIYNRALTANEVAQNFHATRGRYGL